MPATVQIEGMQGREFSGKVERINPSAEPGTRSINIYVSLANEDSLLKAGMFARVLLRTTVGRELPTLPLAALRQEGTQPYVWVISDGKLGRRTIGVGRRDERAQLVEVTDGLAPTDQVLATKFDNLKDGLAVLIIGAAPAPKVADSAPAPAAARAAN
jgi:RND family efflux transporter MFP subunit